MSEAVNQEPKYHHLIAGQILLTEGNNPNLNSVPLNGVITTKEPLIGVHDIGRAQQMLQMLFFKKLPESVVPTINVVDVVILSLTNLGYMTDERFLQKPDGVAVQERETKPTMELVVDNTTQPEPANDSETKPE